jgi:hypothetical protein
MGITGGRGATGPAGPSFSLAINPIAIGIGAGTTTQSTGGIAIGQSAGYIGQSTNGIAIGNQAAYTNQGGGSLPAIAIGTNAGKSSQGSYSVAIGENAGYNSQQPSAISIGPNAGYNSQQQSAIAIGKYAGYIDQGQHSIAIGNSAGTINQGVSSIAIGTEADAQGTSSIVIGNAASDDSLSNAIVLNATGMQLIADYPNGFHVKPIRQDNSATVALAYFPSTGEIVTSTAIGAIIPSWLNRVWYFNTYNTGGIINIPANQTNYPITWPNLTTNATGGSSTTSLWVAPSNVWIKISIVLDSNPQYLFQVFPTSTGSFNPPLSFKITQGSNTINTNTDISRTASTQFVTKASAGASFGLVGNNVSFPTGFVQYALEIVGSMIVESFDTF